MSRVTHTHTHAHDSSSVVCSVLGVRVGGCIFPIPEAPSQFISNNSGTNETCGIFPNVVNNPAHVWCLMLEL